MGRKSLSEQLAEYIKPVKDFDIEDNDFPTGEDDQDNSEMSEESDNEASKTEHYVKVGKSNLRRINSTPLGEYYNGKVADRSSLYGNGSSSEDEQGSSLENEDIDEEENSDADKSNYMTAESENEGFDDSDSSNSNEDKSESSSPESEEYQEEYSSQHNEDVDYKRNQIKEMISAERSNMVSRLSQVSTSDSLKGYIISQQSAFFDDLVNIRMKLHKAVSNANFFPGSFESLGFSNVASKGTKSLVNEAEEACYDLLDNINSLRMKLMKDDGILEDTKKLKKLQKSKKRSLEYYSDFTADLDDKIGQYRRNVLNKWSAKVSNFSGSTAINSSKFRAINQSAEQQVVNNLANMDRLFKRTRLNRRNVEPLDLDYIQQKTAKKNEAQGSENEDIPVVSADPKNALAELDQIFDDEDFYRVLLNDLVDRKMHTANPSNGVQITIKSTQRADKLKKNVDSKASKGRKLKYDIQDPIANFEAPNTKTRWTDYQIDELFASLLGQKINMNEENENLSSEDEEEKLTLGSNSIKLFG